MAEEAEKKRKELELELKKLRTEIADAYKAFDDKVRLFETQHIYIMIIHIGNGLDGFVCEERANANIRLPTITIRAFEV